MSEINEEVYEAAEFLSACRGSLLNNCTRAHKNKKKIEEFGGQTAAGTVAADEWREADVTVTW